MIEDKFKQALWVMNEIRNASPTGITREALSSKWAVSSMNDDKEEHIAERTFHRIRRRIERVFNVEILCSKGNETRYYISSEYLEPGSDNLLSLILGNKRDPKSKPSYMLDILGLIMAGKELPNDDLSIIKTIATQLNRIPYDYGTRMITAVKNGEVSDADSADWDEDYRRYVCVWNEEVYNQTGIWLSIGIYNDHILFYVVTEQQDFHFRERMSECLEVYNGEKYERDYWWYEPTDKSIFKLDFQTFPDLEEIKRRTALLLSRIAAFANAISTKS